jgi:hypothetical protein
MHRDADGNTAPALGERVGVSDSPGQVRAGAIAGAGEQRADLLKCDGERERRRENIRRGAKRHSTPPYEDPGSKKSEACSGCREHRVMNHRNAQHPYRVTAQDRPVGDDEKNA